MVMMSAIEERLTDEPMMIIHLTKVYNLLHNASHGSKGLSFLRFSGRCGGP
jgi:hypothetical protein